MGLSLFFLPNFPGAMFIQRATFIPDSYLLKSVTCKRKLSGSLQHNFSNFAQARARVGNMKVSSLRECSTMY